MVDVGQWQQRLRDHFGQDGVIGRNLEPMSYAQAEYGAWVADTFRGFMALSESFLSFHFDLPEILNRYVLVPIRESGVHMSPAYGIAVVRHVSDFRILHAARRLYFDGSPLEATASLRPVFDAALIRSALMQGFSTVEAAEGLVDDKPGTPIDYDRVRRNRIKEEKRIDRVMVGDESGLSDGTMEQLRRWEGLLHAELHGGRLSQAAALKWLRGEEALHMLPSPVERNAAMLMNRWVEIAWMVHRLMPTLQLPNFRFSEEWRTKWQVLDESFVPAVMSLSEQLGKPIGAAMHEFVLAKFPFSAASACSASVLQYGVT